MLKVLRVLASTSLLLVAAAAPVRADHARQAHSITIDEGGITATCVIELNGSYTISGTVQVESGTGAFTFALMGNRVGLSGGYEQIATTTVSSTAPGTYNYSFSLSAAEATDFQSFRVDSVSPHANPEKSPSFNIDTCVPVIPETPFVPLLAVTGGLVALWFVSRRMRALARTTA